LLDKIRNYYEQKQPYKRTDFSVAQLSDAIGANTFYIGQAISKTGMNFSEFTNNYRIDLVKAMIEDGYLDKFSITHLYEQAGFRSQSTFNENFKKIVGITPNEYRRRVKTLSDKKATDFAIFRTNCVIIRIFQKTADKKFRQRFFKIRCSVDIKFVLCKGKCYFCAKIYLICCQ